MYRYSNYIARHLVHSMLLITFSLTSIVWLTQALRFIDFIVNQGVSVAVFLRLTLLLIPSLLLMILPPALFCSVIFVYNKLKAESELVVLQAAGLSKWRLAQPALLVAAGTTVVAYIIALYLLPISYGKFRDMQNFLRNNYVSILLQEGVFSSPVEGLTIFIRERDRDGTLHGILVHDNRNPQAPVTMMAEEGRLVDTPEGPRFLLKNGNRQEMKGGHISFLYYDSYTLDISLYAKAIGRRPTDTMEMFLPQLLAYNPSETPTDNQKRIAEGHQRIIWPGYCLTLALIAIAVLLSGQFNRRGQWRRVTLAVALGSAVMFSAVGLRGMTASDTTMEPLAYLNLLLPAAIALMVLVDRVPHYSPRIRMPLLTEN